MAKYIIDIANTIKDQAKLIIDQMLIVVNKKTIHDPNNVMSDYNFKNIKKYIGQIVPIIITNNQPVSQNLANDNVTVKANDSHNASGKNYVQATTGKTDKTGFKLSSFIKKPQKFRTTKSRGRGA